MSGPARTSENPSKLMIVNCWGEDAVFYNLETLSETTRLELPPQPHEIRLDTKRNLVYVSLPYKDGFYDMHKEKAHHLVVIDPKNEQIVDTIDISPEAGPHALEIDEGRDILWMSVESHGGAVVGLDLDTRKLVARVATGEGDGKPHWMTMTSDGSTMYTANKESRFASVLDLDEGVLKAQIPMPGGSEDVELNADETRLFISSRELPVLHVIDTASNEELGQVALDDLPGRVYLTSAGKLIVTHFHFPYQTESGRAEQGRISIVNPVELTQERSITVGMGPMDLTSTTDGSLAYITNSRSGTMYEIGLEELDVRRAIRTGPIGHASHGVLLL